VAVLGCRHPWRSPVQCCGPVRGSQL